MDRPSPRTIRPLPSMLVDNLPAPVRLTASGAVRVLLLSIDGDRLLILAAVSSLGRLICAGGGHGPGVTGVRVLPGNRLSGRRRLQGLGGRLRLQLLVGLI